MKIFKYIDPVWKIADNSLKYPDICDKDIEMSCGRMRCIPQIDVRRKSLTNRWNVGISAKLRVSPIPVRDLIIQLCKAAKPFYKLIF